MPQIYIFKILKSFSILYAVRLPLAWSVQLSWWVQLEDTSVTIVITKTNGEVSNANAYTNQI